ncbi:MAG: hypothetical protein OXJ56_00615 [Rhodospirillaceae bacterium]|nr:hypothetical protein [Rhodospirillaceae bacterium]
MLELILGDVVPPAARCEVLVLLSMRPNPLQGVLQAVVELGLYVHPTIQVVHGTEPIHAFEAGAWRPLMQQVDSPADPYMDLFRNFAVLGLRATEDALGRTDEFPYNLKRPACLQKRQVLFRQGNRKRFVPGGRIKRRP